MKHKRHLRSSANAKFDIHVAPTSFCGLRVVRRENHVLDRPHERHAAHYPDELLRVKLPPARLKLVEKRERTGDAHSGRDAYNVGKLFGWPHVVVLQTGQLLVIRALDEHGGPSNGRARVFEACRDALLPPHQQGQASACLPALVVVFFAGRRRRRCARRTRLFSVLRGTGLLRLLEKVKVFSKSRRLRRYMASVLPPGAAADGERMTFPKLPFADGQEMHVNMTTSTDSR